MGEARLSGQQETLAQRMVFHSPGPCRNRDLYRVPPHSRAHPRLCKPSLYRSPRLCRRWHYVPLDIHIRLFSRHDGT